jgi:hypothetical protein
MAIARGTLAVWWRRRPALVGWTLAVPLALVGLSALAVANAATIDPGAVASMVRGSATLGALVGAAAGLHAWRAVDRQRSWWDVLPVSAKDEGRARLLIGGIMTAPVWIGGSAVAASVGLSSAPEPAVAAGWAIVVVTAFVTRREAGDRLEEPSLPRLVLIGFVGCIVAVAGTTLALVPWALVAWVRSQRDLVAARRARRRFETYLKEDDHD